MLSLRRAPSVLSSIAPSRQHPSEDAWGTESSLPRFEHFPGRGGTHILL